MDFLSQKSESNTRYIEEKEMLINDETVGRLIKCLDVDMAAKKGADFLTLARKSNRLLGMLVNFLCEKFISYINSFSLWAFLLRWFVVTLHKVKLLKIHPAINFTCI